MKPCNWEKISEIWKAFTREAEIETASGKESPDWEERLCAALIIQLRADGLSETDIAWWFEYCFFSEHGWLSDNFDPKRFAKFVVDRGGGTKR